MKKYIDYGITVDGEIYKPNDTDEVWVQNTEMAFVHNKREAELIAASAKQLDGVTIESLRELAYHVSNGGIRAENKAVDFLRGVISPEEFGTASEVSDAVGVARTTLIDGAKRGEIRHTYTTGGTLLIEVSSAKKWAKGTRKTGPKPKD